MKEHYRGNNLLIPFGGDFFYKNSLKWYKNIDKLIEGFNDIYQDVQLLYSTPGKFFSQLKQDPVKWPV